jgi:hypothetical protein
MYATLDKAKPNTEIVRGLDLAVVKLTTIEVVAKLSGIWHNLLYWTDRGTVYVVCMYYCK